VETDHIQVPSTSPLTIDFDSMVHSLPPHEIQEWAFVGKHGVTDQNFFGFAPWVDANSYRWSRFVFKLFKWWRFDYLQINGSMEEGSSDDEEDDDEDEDDHMIGGEDENPTPKTKKLKANTTKQAAVAKSKAASGAKKDTKASDDYDFNTDYADDGTNAESEEEDDDEEDDEDDEEETMDD
jgi:hypothetical protein